jgi:hypothetical protein
MMRRQPNAAQTTEWSLPESDDAPAEVRALLETRLAGLEPELMRTTQLLACELISLSRRSQGDASGSAVLLGLHLDDARVRLEVARSDGRFGFTPAGAEEPDLSLSLIDELADRWGVTCTERGTVCWLEIDHWTAR